MRADRTEEQRDDAVEGKQGNSTHDQQLCDETAVHAALLACISVFVLSFLALIESTMNK